MQATESYITNCQERDETGGRLNAIISEPIDGVAVIILDSAAALGNTINEMEKY